MVQPRRRASSPADNTTTSSFSHPRLSFSMQLLIPLLSVITPVSATPVSYFPLNSQLPPVARISETFSFVFSPLTFSSDTEMSYALAEGSPPWLSLDSGSRQLSGTPDEASAPAGETVVGVPIALVATDETGSTTANATLVVSRSPGPTVRIPLEEQIGRLGPFSAPSSVLLHPSREFAFTFDQDTFSVDNNENTRGQGEKRDEQKNQDEDRGMAGSGPQLNYYAVSGDNAPLPSWVVFDAEKLAFSGKTPPFESLVQPPQTFDLQLVASDIMGFSSASIAFSIVVGNHELTAEKPVVELNATKGTQLEYTDLPNILKFDKRPLKPDDIASIRADGLPAWLSFDEKSWKVSGTPDTMAQPTNVTIAVVDKFSDTLNLTLAVVLETKIFVSDLPDLDISAGGGFSFDLKRFLFSPIDTQVVIELEPDDSWIRFDDSSKVLSGTVPKTLSAGFTSEIRIAFNATQKRTKEQETKYLNIHADSPPGTSKLPQPTQAQPSRPSAKADDSHRDLLWLLVIPFLLLALAVIWALFLVRKRRQRPKKLNFAEVSAPIPGTFVVNSSTNTSLHDTRNIRDTGPKGPSKLRTSQTTSNPSINGDYAIPHAMAIHSGTVKLTEQGNANVETRDSCLAGQKGQPSPMGTDEISLLSDTSLKRAKVDTAEELPQVSRKLDENAYEKKIGLEIPIIAEPFSIQPTPELAYTAGKKYDFVFDDQPMLTVDYPNRRKSGHQQNTGLGLRNVQHRLSKAWKRGSASKLLEDLKRNSNLSSSTDVTTRTSILTSGITEEATTTSTNVVAKPTVIHIPSRTGEARQVSRRTDDSSTFFGGRSLTKSQRNFGLAKDAAQASPAEEIPRPPASFEDQDTAQDSDTSWDELARNSLGIAYKDLIQTNRETRKSIFEPEESRIGLAESKNWKTHHTSQELMSPDQWPIPATYAGLVGITDGWRSQSEPPQLPPLKTYTKAEAPVTPKAKGKKRASYTRRTSRGSGSLSSLSQTPSTYRRSNRRSSHDERSRMSGIREQRALEEFRAMMSQTPSPSYEWPVTGIRQLPETPTRASRVPLTDRLNEAGARSGGRVTGLKSTISKRSVRTLRSNKSVRSAWGNEEEDDDDAWEDIRPPESTVGGWDAEGSDGSFPVYI
ncbi:hypothetical protein F5Y19DRAFT_316907 [Xylariaceae sp. FL1651]|nr:hypothetical protein F5Y19DRAFT_316907 [Xylariaceae sp. FL1651]